MGIIAIPFVCCGAWVERTKDWTIDMSGSRLGLIEDTYYNMGDGRIVKSETILRAGNVVVTIPIRTSYLCLILFAFVGLVGVLLARCRPARKSAATAGLNSTRQP